MNDKHLIYFCNDIGSVFYSQVIELLNRICEEKYFYKQYLILGIKNREEKSKIKEEIIHPNLKIIYYKSFSNFPFTNLLNRVSLKSALKWIRILDKDIIFHTREEILGWHLFKILNKSNRSKILIDIRGANIEEIKQYYDSILLWKKLKVLNYKKSIKTLAKIKNISVVSESLKNYLINNFRIERERIFITSSLAGKDFKFDCGKRKQIRNELCVQDDEILLVFSSGGGAEWQNNYAIKLFAEKRFKVLNLSKKTLLHKNIINKFVDYFKMPDYLAAADAAIIWREESIVNKVASPVKFSEYLCCGLPVISNNKVDLIVDVINKYNVGIILEKIDQLNEETISKILKQDRQYISQVGQENFGLENILKKYRTIYQNI